MHMNSMLTLLFERGVARGRSLADFLGPVQEERQR
jgi:hypothetical protein